MLNLLVGYECRNLTENKQQNNSLNKPTTFDSYYFNSCRYPTLFVASIFLYNIQKRREVQKIELFISRKKMGH